MMKIELYKQDQTDDLMIIISLEDSTGFLLSKESYQRVLFLENITSYCTNRLDNYEIIFNEELQNFILTKVIKGILQFKILNLPAILFSTTFDSAKELKGAYTKIKEVYKELITIGLNKKLTLKEKLIIKLFVR